MSFNELEKALSLVPGEGKAPPEFYLTLPNESKGLPLTKIATAKFGAISGVKPSIYREFVGNGQLTAQMIRHSMTQPDRGGEVYVASISDRVLGFYLSGKPHLGVTEAWNALEAVGAVTDGEIRVTVEGIVEMAVLGGGPSDSVRPGILLSHDGRTKVGTYLQMHDGTATLSPLRASKKKKAKEACAKALTRLVEETRNTATSEAQHVYELASSSIPMPSLFLSRLALLDGFSSQSAERMVAGAEASLDPGPTYYDVVRYVAGWAVKGERLDRRMQLFAHTVAFKGSSVCRACGLPS